VANLNKPKVGDIYKLTQPYDQSMHGLFKIMEIEKDGSARGICIHSEFWEVKSPMNDYWRIHCNPPDYEYIGNELTFLERIIYGVSDEI
jgi:hypothetical protein